MAPVSIRIALALVIVAATTAVACGSGGANVSTADDLVGSIAEVHVYDAWVPVTDGTDAEVSMRVHNAGPEDDRLLEASCACDARVAIDGAVVVAPEQEIVLAPGGTPGIRLMELEEPLPEGAFVTLTMTFEHAGRVDAEVEVRRRGA
jgi:copper(I)-binding protein